MLRIEVNGLLYEEGHPDCLLIQSSTSSGSYAFVQVLDIDTQMVKRYWGPFDIEQPETSIENIMRHGGNWPALLKAEQQLES